MMYTYLLIIAFKLCPEVHIEQQNKNLPFWMIWNKILVCNWVLDHKAKSTLHLLLVYKSMTNQWDTTFLLHDMISPMKTDDAMKSHFVNCRSQGNFFTSCWIWVTSVPKGFSSCIPALKKMYDNVILLTCKKKQLMHVLMDKNQLFIDVLDECFMVCL